MKPDQMTQAELEAAHYAGKYIVTYSRVFEARYSQAQMRWYLMEYPELYHSGWVKRGTFELMTAEEVNAHRGFEVLMPI